MCSPSLWQQKPFIQANQVSQQQATKRGAISLPQACLGATRRGISLSCNAPLVVASFGSSKALASLSRLVDKPLVPAKPQLHTSLVKPSSPPTSVATVETPLDLKLLALACSSLESNTADVLCIDIEMQLRQGQQDKEDNNDNNNKPSLYFNLYENILSCRLHSSLYLIRLKRQKLRDAIQQSLQHLQETTTRDNQAPSESIVSDLAQHSLTNETRRVQGRIIQIKLERRRGQVKDLSSSAQKSLSVPRKKTSYYYIPCASRHAMFFFRAALCVALITMPTTLQVQVTF